MADLDTIKSITSEYEISIIDKLAPGQYDGLIIAVAHDQFKEMGGIEIRKLCKPTSIIYDLKSILHIQESDMRL